MAYENFKRGLWSGDMLRALVTRGKLTAEEFEEITGNEY